MSFSTLERRDNSKLLNSYLYVYNTSSLYSIENDYRNNILRIVKKSILGTNFSYGYSKQYVFVTPVVYFVIINTFFVIIPQLFFHSSDIEFLIDEMENAEEILKNNNNMYLPIFSKKSTDFVFRLFLSNFIQTFILAALTIVYKYKENKINRYMEKYTQCAIEEENKYLKGKYNCNISSDGKFSIEINKKDDESDYKPNNYNKSFFQYVINFSNVKNASNYLYKKILLPKEVEIINRIVAISKEIENKYRKKLISFIILIISIMLFIPLLKFISMEKKLNYLHYFSIFILTLFVQINIFLNNKTEQITNITSLNSKYINDGYYIYINNDIISIFYLKEEYKNIESIDKIKKLNEQLLKNFELI